MMKIYAVRENLETGEKRSVEIEVELFTTDAGEPYFKVTKGGITGSATEGIALYLFSSQPEIIDKGWIISGGMKGKWDRLTVPPCQLDKLLGEVGL